VQHRVEAQLSKFPDITHFYDPFYPSFVVRSAVSPSLHRATSLAFCKVAPQR
jgi:hypothetical protein